MSFEEYNPPPHLKVPEHRVLGQVSFLDIPQSSGSGKMKLELDPITW